MYGIYDTMKILTNEQYVQFIQNFRDNLVTFNASVVNNKPAITLTFKSIEAAQIAMRRVLDFANIDWYVASVYVEDEMPEAYGRKPPPKDLVNVEE